MPGVNLRNYDNSWYYPGRSALWRVSWLLFGLPVLRSRVIPSSSLRRFLLKLFGARIGQRVTIKPGVEVKYPWLLAIGDDCWIGEGCWIDNLVTVTLGSSVCISQGAYLCTGNHDWSDPRFGLMVAPITLGDGAWAGAKCILLPGTVLGEGAVVAAGSVATGRIPEYEVFAGNPAVFIKRRSIRIPARRDVSSDVLSAAVTR